MSKPGPTWIKRALSAALPGVLFAIVSATTATASTDSVKFPPLGPNSLMVARTTAYNHREADHLRFGSKNALGGELRLPGEDIVIQNESGTIRTFEPKVGSAAADWSRFPAGTRFMVVRTQEVYEVDDYGIALAGTKTLDLYKPNLDEMNRWGVRHERIRILKVGSFTRSLLHLAKCPPHAYIVAMREEVKKRVKEDTAQPRMASARTAPATNVSADSSGGTYKGPRPDRMPPPLPKGAYLRNKPASPNPDAWKRNMPR